MGTNWAKWGQTGLNRAKGGKHCMHKYFYERKKSYLATQALRQKMAELWRYCYFLGYYRLSLKTWAVFLYLSEEFFLYHLKAYLYGFILSRGFKFLGAPLMA